MRPLGECIGTLRSLSRPVRWRIWITVAAGVLRVAASMCFVWASKHLVDIATGVSGDSLWGGIGLFAGILAFQLIIVLFFNWWEGYSAIKAQNRLRQDIFSHVLKSRWDGRERFLSGDTVNRLEEDIRVVSELIIVRYPGVIITVMQLAAASVYLLKLAPNLLWVLLVLMFAAVVGSRLFFRRLRRLMTRIRTRESELQQLMQESLLHRVLMLTIGGVEKVIEKFGWLQKDIEDSTRKRLDYNAMARGFMFFGFQAGHAAAFLWGVFGIIHGTVTYGMMTAFLQLVGQVQRPVAELGRQVPAFINAISSVERLMELQELEKEPETEPVTIDGAPEIVVDSVSYTYPGQSRKVFDNFSCTFPSGSLTIVAGATGVGKSTLIRMILGLLRPDSGSVTIGGHPCGAALRGNFMYIPQGNSLLSGTIRSNLLLADPAASESGLRRVLETAAAGFVFDLPQGLDTPCGEVGSGLSEGQAQRIAIARALLRKGGVMILDEATSALDKDTEERLLENLCRDYHGTKTILLISHRDAASRYADFKITIPD
ncbi:MAG: ABC transporter ATP-binding protein [Bacteroidales bacterium]|nr:ABC transporter ATP-binding protein [Bacteroidales bacterium]